MRVPIIGGYKNSIQQKSHKDQNKNNNSENSGTSASTITYFAKYSKSNNLLITQMNKKTKN